jgi:sulfoacetaldehyde dehydrogenase
MSKTSDFGSGCSADGNILIDSRIYGRLRRRLVKEGGIPGRRSAGVSHRKVMWDAHGHRRPETVACPPQVIAAAAGFVIPAGSQISHRRRTTRLAPSTTTRARSLTTLLAVYRYEGFEQALDMVRRIYEVGGKGHSCGIYSHD